MCVNAISHQNKNLFPQVVTLLHLRTIQEMKQESKVIIGFSINSLSKQILTKYSCIIIGYDAGHFVLRVHGFSHHIVVVKKQSTFLGSPINYSSLIHCNLNEC